MAALAVLSSLEASFRVDYLVRCYEKKKDKISMAFRKLHKTKRDRPHLEGELLAVWKLALPTVQPLISQLIGALKYRHWLAHGRYWTPKLGGKYDFLSVLLLAQSIHADVPLKSH